MTKPRIIFYTVGTLPHYLPLYLAAEELSNRTFPVIVEWKEIVAGTESLHLFDRAARDSQQSDRALHIVLSGQVERVFDQSVSATALIDQFVAASVLIHRVPLWLVCHKDDERAIRTVLATDGHPNPPTAFLPNEGTTLCQEFFHEFGRDKFEAEHFDRALTTYDESDILTLKAESKITGPWVFASLFPIETNNLTILNDRLPTQSVGFTTLWLWKGEVFDDDLMLVFRAFADQVHMRVVELYDLDIDILYSRDAKLLTGLEGNCQTWLKEYETGPKSSAFAEMTAQKWWPSRHRFLAHFLLHRIWDTDFNFVRPSRRIDSQSRATDAEMLYHRSLAATYRSANIGAIRDAFGKSVEMISGKLAVLKEITDAVEDLSQRLHLTEDPLIPFDDTFVAIQQFLRLVFKDWHDVRDFYQEDGNTLKEEASTQFIDAARELANPGGSHASIRDMEPTAGTPAFGGAVGSRVGWISTLCDTISDIESQWSRRKAGLSMPSVLVTRIQHVITLASRAIAADQSSAQDITAALLEDRMPDGRSLLLCELKALSKRNIPISWLLCLNEGLSVDEICKDYLFFEGGPGPDGPIRGQTFFYGVNGGGALTSRPAIHQIERNMATFLELLASSGRGKRKNAKGAKGGAIRVKLDRSLFESGGGFLSIEISFEPDRPGSGDSFARLAAIAYGVPRLEEWRYGKDSRRLLQLRDFGLQMSVMHNNGPQPQAVIVVTINNKMAHQINTT